MKVISPVCLFVAALAAAILILTLFSSSTSAASLLKNLKSDSKNHNHAKKNTKKIDYVHLVPNPKPNNGWVKLVEELPSYPGKTPPAPLYSGMVEITRLRNNQPGVEQVFMHYTLLANTNTQYDEIVNFISGGPGFPSSGSMFLEGVSGLQLNAYSYLTEEYQRTGIPSPLDRQFGWNELGVVVGFDNPPPTGYSYCTPIGPSGNGSSCGTWNDTMTGIAQAEALNIVLTDHFPNLLPQGTSRKVFSFAESYGGVYAAALAEQIFTRSEYAHLASRFAGQANGDACMGSDFICGSKMESKPWWFLSFMYGRSQIPDDLWQELLLRCGEYTLKNGDPESYNPVCKLAYDNAVAAAGNSFYTYNLYSSCAGDLFDSVYEKGIMAQQQQNSSTKHLHRGRKGTQKYNHKMKGTARSNRAFVDASSSFSSSKINQAENYDGFICMSDSFPIYMDAPEVKKAFGVPTDMNFFIADNAVGLPYNFTMMDGFKIWKDLISSQLNISASPTSFPILPRPAGSPPVRVMGYQGDADPAVLITWTQKVWYEFANNFTTGQSSFGKTKEWRDYFLASPKTDSVNAFSTVPGGKAVEWGLLNNKGGSENTDGLLGYYTVAGSGHMVPEFKSHAAKAMVRKFMYRDQ